MRIRRRGRRKPDGPESGRNAPAATPPRRSPPRPRFQKYRRSAAAPSSNLALEKRNLENLFVIDGAMSEITVLAEKLAVISRNGDPGVLGDDVKQFLHHAIPIFAGI